jgi:hypothetical protein
VEKSSKCLHENGERCKHEELKEALAIWIWWLNDCDTATDKAMKEMAKIICKHCTLLLY